MEKDYWQNLLHENSWDPNVSGFFSKIQEFNLSCFLELQKPLNIFIFTVHFLNIFHVFFLISIFNIILKKMFNRENLF